jgi:short-subunit dehydrogenase
VKAAILGATKGMGKSLARLMAERGETLFLLGRAAAALQAIADDLRARSENPVAGAAPCDLLDPDGFAAALDAADTALGGMDCVIVTAGILLMEEDAEADLDRTAQLLAVNYSNTILFCEHARRRLLDNGGGTLCVFGSVAGDRGRTPSYIYGSTKAGLHHYLEGLDHKYHRAGLHVVCVKPGFVRTPMTVGLDEPPFAGDPDHVARDVLRAIDRGTPVLYSPAVWRWIMFVVKRLPRAVMRRLDF